MDVANLKTEVVRCCHKTIYKRLKKSYHGKDLKFYFKQLTKITEAGISLTPIKITKGIYQNSFEADVYYSTNYSGRKLSEERDIELRFYVIKKNFEAKPIEKFAIDMIGKQTYLFRVMPDHKDRRAYESFERNLKYEAEKIAENEFKARHREDCYNFGIFVEEVRPYVSTLRGKFQVQEIMDWYAITAKICLKDGQNVNMLIGVAKYDKEEIKNYCLIGGNISLPYNFFDKNSVEFAMFDDKGKTITLTKKPFKGYC